MKTLVLILLVLFPLSGATQTLNRNQMDLIQEAYQVGKPYDLSYTLVGILMQETLAGKLGRVGDLNKPLGMKSYGVMQVKLKTAQKVLRAFPSLGHFKTPEGLIGALMYNDRFCLEVALDYFRLLLRRGLTWREAVAAYNLGPSGVRRLKHPEQYKYVKRVVDYIHSIREHNYALSP